MELPRSFFKRKMREIREEKGDIFCCCSLSDWEKKKRKMAEQEKCFYSEEGEEEEERRRTEKELRGEEDQDEGENEEEEKEESSTPKIEFGHCGTCWQHDEGLRVPGCDHFQCLPCWQGEGKFSFIFFFNFFFSFNLLSPTKKQKCFKHKSMMEMF